MDDVGGSIREEKESRVDRYSQQPTITMPVPAQLTSRRESWDGCQFGI